MAGSTKPKKPKATIYGLNIYGHLYREEVVLVSHGRTDRIASNHKRYGPAPFVLTIKPPRKTRRTYTERGDWKSRYLLILGGWGHPVPPTFGNHHRRDNAHVNTAILKPWDDMIDAYVLENGIEVIGDYRDIINPAMVAAYRAIEAQENRQRDEMRAEWARERQEYLCREEERRRREDEALEERIALAEGPGF